MTPETLAVIPARGGSKRVPRKNIRPFHGVPLLARTVELLRSTNSFDRIVVSTDDDEVAAIATGAGADVPFRRPPELADDVTPTIPVIEHAIRASGSAAKIVCCVYPAAALALADDFRTAREMLTSGVDYVFAATSFPHPIQRALRLRDDGSCEMFWPEHRLTRSQDLEPAYHDAGWFYWGQREAWLEQRPFFGRASRMLIVPHDRVQDIDTAEDWRRAEWIYELRQREA